MRVAALLEVTAPVCYDIVIYILRFYLPEVGFVNRFRFRRKSWWIRRKGKTNYTSFRIAEYVGWYVHNFLKIFLLHFAFQSYQSARIEVLITYLFISRCCHSSRKFINTTSCWNSLLVDLSHRVDSVTEETMKLRSENQVLGQYIENLMSASSVFQSTSPKPKKK